jgi:hypothetical protein
MHKCTNASVIDPYGTVHTFTIPCTIPRLIPRTILYTNWYTNTYPYPYDLLSKLGVKKISHKVKHQSKYAKNHKILLVLQTVRFEYAFHRDDFKTMKLTLKTHLTVKRTPKTRVDSSKADPADRTNRPFPLFQIPQL